MEHKVIKQEHLQSFAQLTKPLHAYLINPNSCSRLTV